MISTTFSEMSVDAYLRFPKILASSISYAYSNSVLTRLCLVNCLNHFADAKLVLPLLLLSPDLRALAITQKPSVQQLSENSNFSETYKTIKIIRCRMIFHMLTPIKSGEKNACRKGETLKNIFWIT
jgi:hypothetical protein